MTDTSLTNLTLHAAREAVRSGQVSPLELTEAHLARIESLNPRLGAYLEVTADSARAEARAATEALAKPGRADLVGPLHGLPLAMKDLYDVRGAHTTAGSPLLKDNLAVRDSFVASRLREAGAIFLGKTNMHEWALGVTNINLHFGPSRNPWDTERITGGSSGGSASAVGAGLCLGTFGSDTGGSIRIPASLCGIVGLKPTYGRISLTGAVPLAWSLDHPGPMTRTVRDAAILYQVAAGYDPDDPASSPQAELERDLEWEPWAKGLKVGVAEPAIYHDLEAEAVSIFQRAVKQLSELGASIQEVPLHGYAEAEEASRRILLTEAAAFHRERMEQHPEDIGADVLPRFRMGAEFSGVQYAEARRSQAEWKRTLARLFETVDLLVLPATPVAALPIADSDALKMAALYTRYTRNFNLAGVPALVLPGGFNAAGLPIGLQIVGPAWAEARVLRLALAYEAAAGWHKRQPPL